MQMSDFRDNSHLKLYITQLMRVKGKFFRTIFIQPMYESKYWGWSNLSIKTNGLKYVKPMTKVQSHKVKKIKRNGHIIFKVQVS